MDVGRPGQDFGSDVELCPQDLEAVSIVGAPASAKLTRDLACNPERGTGKGYNFFMPACCRVVLFALVAVLTGVTTMGQTSSPQRRIANPETIHLPSGSRVEFHAFHSRSLKKTLGYSVFLPAGYDSNEQVYPVVYFLHGMNNDHTSWCVGRYGNLPKILDQTIREQNLPEFVMLHPAGERGYYTDSADGRALYERAFQDDFINAMESRYRIRKDQKGRALAGTSMGGYGALKLAFKNPGFYAAVAAGSPIVLVGDDPAKLLRSGDSRRVQFFSGLLHSVYGTPVDQKHWRANRLENLVHGDLNGLRVMVLYGTADRYNQMIPMEEGIRHLGEILESRKVDHQLHIFDGEPHGWRLMSAHLPQILQFLASGF